MKKNKRAARAARTLEREERTVNLEFSVFTSTAHLAYFCDIGEFEQGQRVKYRVEH